MKEPSLWEEMPGGRDFCAWFGGPPSFHDAELLQIRLASDAESRLRLHIWRMTDEVDEQGYYVLDRHVVVTLTLEGVSDIALSHFNLPGIVSALSLTRAKDAIELAWEGSYGVEGRLRARALRVDFQPGKPAAADSGAKAPAARGR